MNLKDIDLEQKISTTHENILKEVSKIKGRITREHYAPIIEEIKIIEKFSNHKNRYYVLFSQTKFFPVYVSANIKEQGYSQEELYNSGLFNFLEVIDWKLLPLGLKVHQWGTRFRKLTGRHTTLSHETFFCGLRIKNRKNNQQLIFFIKQKFLKVDKNGEPLLSFLEIEEISTVFKRDFVWVRMTSKYNSIPLTRVFFSKGSKKEYPELLSEREFEILNLVMENKDSNQISELLSISSETVKRHRKNMIARVGAKDMTALIHICRLCNLV